MKFSQNQTFTLTTDDSQQLTYRIQTITDDGRLLVHSSLLERSYFVSQQAFRDFLQFIGVTLPESKPDKYRVYYINHSKYSGNEFEFINEAIEYGKNIGYEFKIRLGDMICCAWDPITGLRFFAEYQSWKQSQEVRLVQVEGTYP